MDGDRFDALARRLARAVSRRSVLKGAGGLAAGVVGATGVDEADAFICRRAGVLCAKDAHCCSGACDTWGTWRCLGVCDQGLTECDGQCVDTQTNADHCGGCADDGGEVCATADGEVCLDGVCCTPGCPNSFSCCVGDPRGISGHCPTCCKRDECCADKFGEQCGCVPLGSDRAEEYCVL